MLSRRSIVAALAFATVVSCSVVHAQESEFKIGGLGTFTGPFSVLGESMRKGAELAADVRNNKVLGVPIRFEWEDDETKPQIAVQKAMRMASDGVHILFAPPGSGSTAAVSNVAERTKTPFLVTASILDDIITKSNPYTFRTSNPAYMEVAMLGRFMEKSAFKKVYLFASDYNIGHDMVTNLGAAAKKAGVEVEGGEFPALGTTDFSILINKIRQSDADAVYVGLAGNDLISFLKQADQVKLQDTKPLFGLVIMDETLGKAVGDAGIGVNSVLRYHFTIDNDANKSFVQAYRAKYGDYPDQYAGEAYDGVSWFLDVIDSTGGWDKEAWLSAFRVSKRQNSVEGEKVMRACENQASQPGFYGKAVKGSGDLPAVTMEITDEFAPEDVFAPC